MCRGTRGPAACSVRAFILLAILLLPSLGAATLFALVIAGQVLAAVTLDHFGAFGLTPHPDRRRAARRRGSPDRRRRLDQGVKFKAPARSRATPARPRATRETAATGLLRPACSSPPFVPRKTRRAFAVRYGMGPTTSMPPTCFNSLICWTARSASPVTSFSAVKPCWMICAFALMSEAMPRPLDQFCEQNAAGAEPRIGHRARAEQRRAQRRLG